MDQMKPNAANSTPLTPLGFLERAATVYGDCTSVVYNKTTYTWAETHRRCLQLASSLAGIGRGHVVSVIAPNIPPMYELHFAVPMSGAILNCINTRLDARTISLLLVHSESKLVFVDLHSRSLVLRALSFFPSSTRRPLLVLIDDDVGGEPEAAPIPGDAAAAGPVFHGTYGGMVAGGDPSFEWVRPESERDPVVLNYTSGTTSSPKGVVHCHRTLLAVAQDTLIDWSVPKRAVYLWTLPMFHANGWSFPWGIAAVGGVNVCLRRFDAAAIFAAIRTHGVTHMCGAPVVLNMMANSPATLDRPVHILTAGAPPPAAVLARAESLGFVVSHGYGLTETAGIVVGCAWKPKWDGLPPAERGRLKARQGVSTAGNTEADVVDPGTMRSVPRDGWTQGEIVLRGACVMLGYLKDPEGTARCFKGGWFNTGDVAVVHPDGYIEIKDRAKDVIISGGENISSVEVESVLYLNPAVNEAAVVARPDDFWGETPCAFVSLKKRGEGAPLSPPPTEKDIVEFCRASLPHYMVPKTVVFKEELPKTSTGKIQKFVLRQVAKNMGPPRTSRI